MVKRMSQEVFEFSGRKPPVITGDPYVASVAHTVRYYILKQLVHFDIGSDEWQQTIGSRDFVPNKEQLQAEIDKQIEYILNTSDADKIVHQLNHFWLDWDKELAQAKMFEEAYGNDPLLTRRANLGYQSLRYRAKEAILAEHHHRKPPIYSLLYDASYHTWSERIVTEPLKSMPPLTGSAEDVRLAEQYRWFLVRELESARYIFDPANRDERNMPDIFDFQRVSAWYEKNMRKLQGITSAEELFDAFRLDPRIQNSQERLESHAKIVMTLPSYFGDRMKQFFKNNGVVK